MKKNVLFEKFIEEVKLSALTQLNFANGVSVLCLQCVGLSVPH